ncbi:hypothetical protein [Orrella sp. 11846]|uniref:hypothetical protein n=1 Tax=Orrella sp. 11846 TaxID=3409913 RepID=UPI003B598921
MRRLIMLGVMIVIAGCATVGTPITENQLSSFQEGVTTTNDVIASLGKPFNVLRKSDGTTSMTYVYSEASVHPATFIPIVGVFAGGADTKGTSVILNFDKNGKLIDYITSHTSMTTNALGQATTTTEVKQ